MRSGVRLIIVYGSAFNAFRMLVGAISAVYLLSQGLTLTDIGLLKTTQAITILFLDVPLAYFADKYSRRLSVALAVLFGSIWLFLTAIANSDWVYYVAEFFNAVSLALISGALISYLIDVGTAEGTSSDIHKIIGRYQRTQFFVMGISAFVGSAFVTIDNNAIWYTAAIACTVLLLTITWFLPADNVNRSDENSSNKGGFLHDLKTSVSIVKDSNGLLVIMAILMLIMMAFYQLLIQFWQPLSFSGFSEAPEQGIYFGGLFGLILFGQSLAGWFSSKVENSDRLLKAGLTINLATLLVLIIGLTAFAWLVPFSIIATFFANRLSTIAVQGKFHERVPSRLRSTFDSFVSVVLRTSLLILMPAMGYATEHYGWGAFVSFYAVTALACFFVAGIKSSDSTATAT